MHAEELAARTGAVRFTASRIEVEPNASSTVAALVRLWLDARAGDPEVLREWSRRLREDAEAIARERAVAIELREAAFSPATEFPSRVREALRGASHRAPPRELVCWAGHDAGVLAERIPAGMVLVRNASGVSHAPEEDVSLEDAALAVEAMLHALRAL